MLVISFVEYLSAQTPDTEKPLRLLRAFALRFCLVTFPQLLVSLLEINPARLENCNGMLKFKAKVKALLIPIMEDEMGKNISKMIVC